MKYVAVWFLGCVVGYVWRSVLLRRDRGTYCYRHSEDFKNDGYCVSCAREQGE